MSKMIEIKLSDAQCEALAEEAKAAGLRFFDHCRAKLLANVTLSVKPEPRSVGQAIREAQEAIAERDKNVAIAPKPVASSEDDRIGRLEDAVGQILQALQGGAVAPAEESLVDDTDIDIGDMVSRSLSEAEQQGLTAIDREAAPAAQGGVRHVGTRRPMPFSPATQPRHLNGLV